MKVNRMRSRLSSGLPLLLGLTLPSCAHDVQSPEPAVTGVAPDLICSAQWPEQGLLVAIRGSEFTPMPLDTLEEPVGVELPTVELIGATDLAGLPAEGQALLFSGTAGQPRAEQLRWQSSELLELTLRPSDELAAGVYDLSVTNPDTLRSATREAALVVVDPPTISALDPGALCNGLIDQELRITGENFVEVDGVGPTVRLVDEAGQGYAFGAATVAGCSEVAAASTSVRVCSQLSIDIPGATLPEGRYTVFVDGPIEGGCGSTEGVELEVLDDGPIVFFADPPVAYNGIDTRITLFMTEVTEPFSVQLAPSGEITPGAELDAALVVGTDNRLQATVPVEHAAGSFDVVVNDATGCETRLEAGLTTTSDLSIELGSVSDPFGQSASPTSITIFREGGAEFTATPRAFLNPTAGGTTAIQLESVTLVDADQLTAVVPAGAPVGRYDVVVVNPSGEVGLLEDAFESTQSPPPVIADVVPQSFVNQADQEIVITGSGFDGAAALARCQSGPSSVAPPATSAAESCAAGSCSLTVTVDASGLSPGDVCVMRVTNADGTYAEFSAVGTTNSSFNLSAPRQGRPMIEPRRGLVAASVKATSAARFVYAVGGDGGDSADPHRSVEFAPVSVFGDMSDFLASREPLATPRVDAGGTQIGRYLYVLGGSDGAGALSTAERALVLSPEEAPRIVDLDLCLSGSDEPCFGQQSLDDGLAPGDYSYRVAAVIDSNDQQNLGGETLASDPLPLRLPSVTSREILPQITWRAPRDPLGNELTGIVGWRVYRTPTGGVAGRDEVLLAELDDPSVRTFIDDGSGALGSQTPLPLGSTSAWQALPSLVAARTGLDAAAVEDPASAGTWHLYALLGEGLTSYEYLDVSVLPNGRQTVGSGWTTGAEEAAVARTQFGAWVVDSVVSETVTPGETYIYLGAGLAAGGADDRVEAALVTAGGELAAFTDDPTAGDIVTDFSSTRVGYGSAAAAGRLFVFGGMASQVRADATAAELFNAAPELRNNSWNNEGLSLLSPRYRMGSAIQSAFIFLMGGQTNDSGNVTNSTEMVVW